MNRRAFYPYDGAKITLPECHVKAYFLGSSFEYSRTTEEEKLNHLAYAQNHGFNFWKEIEEKEMPISMLDWNLSGHIVYMRYGDDDDSRGERCDVQKLLIDNLDIKDLYELFLQELKNYVWFEEHGDEIVFHQRQLQYVPLEQCTTIEEIVRPSEIEFNTEEQVKQENPWTQLTNDINVTDPLYSSTKEYVAPQDRWALDMHNQRCKENSRFELGYPPTPWLGNPLKAKVIILSLNPGWKDEVNMEFAGQVRINARESIWSHKLNEMTFKTQGIYGICSDISSVEEFEDFREKYGIPYEGDYLKRLDDYYWQTRLCQLKGKDIRFDSEFYCNFSIIQYCAYHSRNFRQYKSDRLMPSMDYTARLIRYIVAHRPEVMFVMPSAVSQWTELLGNDMVEKLSREGRLFFTHNPRVQYLTPGNLGKENFDKLFSLINNVR